MNPLNLQLTKPLVFLKIHTTGLNYRLDRVVQITISKYHVDGTSKTGTRLINPEMPIPEEATKINGITDDMVNGKPTFYSIAQGLHQFIGDADIAGFNVYFDLNFLMEEFAKARLDFNCSDRRIIDLCSIYHKVFEAAAKQYEGITYIQGAPISSESYTNSCVGILNGMMDKHKDELIIKHDGTKSNFGSSVEEIVETFGSGQNKLDIKGHLIRSESGDIILTYGKKYPNRPLSEIFKEDVGYLRWLTSQDAMPRDTKNIISTYIKKHSTTQSA
jgi:DNA polymerase-3 subunit epsilon